jgi:hypothetical protein
MIEIIKGRNFRDALITKLMLLLPVPDAGPGSSEVLSMWSGHERDPFD